MRTVPRLAGAVFALGTLVLGTVGVGLATTIAPAAADSPGPQAPAANPPMAESCGGDVTLVLDASGSINSSHAVDDVRNAGAAFLDALADTGSTARVLQFASISQQLAPQTEVTAGSMLPGGVFRNALNGYYNPIPPRPGSTNIYQYDGSGDPQSSGNFRLSNNSNQYTNWDQSLDEAGQPQTQPIGLVVYVTDGDPTAFDFNQPGDPFRPGPPPDVAIGTDSGGAAQTTLDRAVQEANQIKTAGTRMLAVGVGNAVTGNAASRNRLIQISGPQTVTDADLATVTSINDVDVALVKDFNKLAAFLRSVVNQLCTPSLAIRKLAQSPGSADYAPAQNWSLTVKPTVAGGTYAWILPDTNADERLACGNPTNPNDQAARTCLTDATGIAGFQWEPDPSDAATSAVVTETPQAGYTPGRPNGPDWQCILKNDDGSADTASGEFGNPPNGFTLDVDPTQIITCSVYNSFNYAPQIALVKVDAPTQVRGDLAPPANTVTSTFTVTNPGNTPLAQVTVTDNRCNPVFQSGDTNGDGLLAPANAETWTYTCTRALTSSPGAAPVTIANEAATHGTDPTGRLVSATANASVAVFAPAITLAKTAAPTTVEVGVATPVTYTYVATNTGNMTLTNVVVTDAAGPATCTPVAPVSVPTLAPGAAATFTCTATITATDPADTFVNNATVTADPIFPDATAAPPAVTAHDSATVTAFQTGIALTKTVDHVVVLPGTPVVYTYQVTNTGTVGLVRTDTAPPGSADPRDGWVIDDQGPTGTCAPVLYDTASNGDANGDQILDPGETWTYTCGTTIAGDIPSVENTAAVTAQPVGGGTELSASATAAVAVVQPGLELAKTTVHPVVLDPAAPALSGPDVPLRTPAVYLYTLHNTGNISVRDPVVNDTFPAQGGQTCPVEAVPPVPAVNAGDTNGDGILDPGESWQYNCVLRSIAGGHALTKADADDPPGFNPLLPSPVTNTAIGSGEAFFDDGPTEVTAAVQSNSASTTVQVISPSISMTKTPCIDDAGALTCADDLLVRPGTDVTYVYRVTNTGDSDVRPVTAVDNLCPVITYVAGDSDDNGLINGGLTPETWEYRCTMAVNPPSPVTNTATFLASGPLGNTYGTVAQASVRIFEPAIDLVKSVSADLVPAGSTVTYTFDVTNAGTVSADGLPSELVLSNIALLDVTNPANPSSASPTFVGGDTNGDGLLDLDPPEVWTYQCTGVINEITVNAAAVEGNDIQGGVVVAADAATVTPFVTGINITKVANPTHLGVGGGPVTYSYEVTNTGNVPLSNVTGRVTDDTCPNVQPVTAEGFNVGDFDHNNLLTGEQDLFETGGPEVWQFTCTTTVTVDTLNTVSVIGTPVRPVADFTSEAAGQAASFDPDTLEVLAPDVTAQAQAQVTVEPTTVPTNPPPTNPPPTNPPPTNPPPPTTSPEVGPGTLPPTGLGVGGNELAAGLGAIAVGLVMITLTRRRVRH